jgi:hypothetical protein
LEAYVPKVRAEAHEVGEIVEEPPAVDETPEPQKPLDMRRRLSEIERKRKQE